MRSSLPRLLVHGGPLPDELVQALAGIVELVIDDPEDSGDGLLVRARPDVLPALRRFREEGGGLPVFVLAEGPVHVADRIRWIREGADDLVAIDTAADYLRRRLAESWKGPEAPPPSAGQRLDRWLQASARYLATRESLIAGLGEGGRSRYLDCVFQRDQVMRTGDGGMPDVFGQRRGMDRETFSWPIVVHQPKALTGNLENIGPDGACLALPTAPPPGQALHASVQGETLRGELVFEARWQRRVAKDRWLVGVCTTACRVHEPPG